MERTLERTTSSFVERSLLPSWNSIILYSTNKVVDSQGNVGFPVVIDPPMGPNSTISELHILQCSRVLVTQHGEVDPTSKLIVPPTLEPSIHKTSSVWHVYGPPQPPNANTTLLESGEWPMLPESGSGIPMSVVDGDYRTFSMMDVYLKEHLGLDPSWIATGAVSEPAGHISPPPLEVKYGVGGESKDPKADPPVLSVGSTQVNHVETAVRLNLNVIAVSLGLTASVMAFLFTMKLLTGPGAAVTSLDSMGILQTIWTFRNNPPLEDRLGQVDKPTDKNLRVAGMLKVQLIAAD
ncbi:hypothetical protein C8R43DRAFT_1105435 [Mycena crocata]|nr:hypothetical protein C8R43DRAFT_1105435 [Mycena crocata]